MGEEISNQRFTLDDFNRFRKALANETLYLQDLFERGALSQRPPMAGFEIEAWLVDRQGEAAPANEAFLARLNNSLVGPELASFNIELNIEPARLTGNVLSGMESSLNHTWGQCRQTATDMNLDVVMIGILPSIREEMLSLTSMTPSNRYRALNEQVLALRNGAPLQLRIESDKGRLFAEHSDVMLEAATTSFQIHLQVPLKDAARLYNTAQIVAAPMVAISANSPWLFGHELWEETRVPLFEQSVDCGGEPMNRVNFGLDYINRWLYECFEDNMFGYPILVPNAVGDDVPRMAHLRFHNGTIWRWNRPLIGFDDDNTPHLRIEHRVSAAGPTVVDSIANAAFFYGLMYGLQLPEGNPRHVLSFEAARENFYMASRWGLAAEIRWPGEARRDIRPLLLDTLLPLAEEGLATLGIDERESRRYLRIIERRAHSEMTGAQWQRRWVQRHGHNMQALTLAYLERQNSGEPVAEWDL